ncbi:MULTISPECIES: 3-hydroxy-9,10-secoandrosta-1,3,5(10)-triene-9,17-dione monooxygenase oxygenase subunit [Rhodococcus]|jgi:3-hydroxy-9,10-secoandrosta-1,3,5(10)-triene-9,17-dione monooxygenase|uniref:3-hydroxy-9,10-secoandrosta-1,3,5(10)-triene-9, 17-dione monooxygenase oxygenase subunit n=1 Tax=Rhodococcus TaxID=1827 RepID=UPI00193B210B|nr:MULTISPECIES: 3-hydroxy-9,10-secoandrosta-1,3,5(10)-triene-9,17-dione monooxygenase oxygenase subunit [Rhodococcus]QRI77699.1 acyl-CoA dehydrogenase family protein [Rhodococcus aetherivorans]QSE61116.1 acyl-CoA dehydrogenase family protein [Rhodococcus sp. PSBB066]QSE67577.1 acyl-CoA dehydrogenase family protein [Rhodococcus sp. PSBB049]WFS16002.1 acyl-CoA dehydrogenase family protein [Rhodococcus aetherivorans]
MSDDVLTKVRELLPSIAERARSVDETRRVPDQTVQDLAAAGVFRMLQPARHGGLESNPVRFYEVVRAISGACGSTGWVASILGVHSWHLALFDARAQDDVWGQDESTLLSSSYAPVGELVPVEGGFELSGSWRFSSGCEHASWALLGALVVGAEGRPVDFMTVLVPRTDYRIQDVWDVVGMRGTASNEITVEKAFVPHHRTVRNYELAQLRAPGHKVNPGPLFRLPFAAIFTTAVAAPVIGTVAGCYEQYLSAMRDRVRLSLGGGRFAEDQFAQVAVARAASEIDAAILQTDRNIRELYELAVAGEPLPTSMRLRVRRDQVRGTERAVEAIDLLFKTAGGNSLGRGNPVERAWRDAHAGSVHVANDPERALALYGRGVFGLPVEDNLV